MGSVDLGREAYGRGDWPRAYRLLSQADQEDRLRAEDVWRLAVAAHLVGRDDRSLASLERACHLHQEEGQVARAAQCAFWLGFRLTGVGDVGRGSAWLARAERLARQVGGTTVVAGWLLIPQVQMRLGAGAHEEAYDLARRASEVAEEHSDPELHAVALHAQGLARLRQARVTEGLSLLDEAMLYVATEPLLPIVTGIVYCSVIAACREVHALDRAHEWTAALSDWCDRQPGLVPFAGTCLVHRSEILQLHGEWEEALAEAWLAEERCRQAGDLPAVAAALYARGELSRLRGHADEAESAYADAARLGMDPQPGLALLRSGHGKHAVAVAAIGRALEETRSATRRAWLLPAAIEVLLAAGDRDGAERALVELEDIAAASPGAALRTVAAHGRGAVRLARGDPAGALIALRTAWHGWQALEAPYRAARVRELVGRACAALGDDEAAAVELDAAREAYRRLGAAPDLARIDGEDRDPHGLTPRELEVLRLVAAGGSNKRIAAELDVSVRTVERHLANIFAKLDLPSRTAAAAFAHEHGLV